MKLAFLGDICLGGGMQASLSTEGPDFPFTGLRSLLAPYDLVIGNLECCVVDEQAHDAPIPPNQMRVPYPLAAGLSGVKMDVVSLANNHILDGGPTGIVSTRSHLDRLGIRYFGAGADRAEAECPLILSHQDVRLGFIGACDVPSVAAGEQQAGVPPLDAARLGARVRDCRALADVVIVVLHADLEFSFHPAPSRVRLSRWLVEQGADLVIQHHPHVCQGIERWGQGLIAYSLGNAVFRVRGNEYLGHRPGVDQGIVLSVDLELDQGRPKLDYDVLPIHIDALNRTVPSPGSMADEQKQFIAAISRDLADSRTIRRARMRRCVAEAALHSRSLYYTFAKQGPRAGLEHFRHLLADPYQRRWMRSLVTLGHFG